MHWQLILLCIYIYIHRTTAWGFLLCPAEGPLIGLSPCGPHKEPPQWFRTTDSRAWGPPTTTHPVRPTADEWTALSSTLNRPVKLVGGLLICYKTRGTTSNFQMAATLLYDIMMSFWKEMCTFLSSEMWCSIWHCACRFNDWKMLWSEYGCVKSSTRSTTTIMVLWIGGCT